MEEVLHFAQSDEIQEMKKRFYLDPESWLDHLHRWAKEELEEGNVELAWKILLQKL